MATTDWKLGQQLSKSPVSRTQTTSPSNRRNRRTIVEKIGIRVVHRAQVKMAPHSHERVRWRVIKHREFLQRAGHWRSPLRIASLILVVFVIAIGCDKRTESEGNSLSEACVPGFRGLGSPFLNAQAGTLSIKFQAFIVGCNDGLVSLPEDTLAEFVKELEDPSEWSPFSVWAERDKPEFRDKVAGKLNEIAKAEIVTDVLITCVGMDDHLRAPE